MADAASPGVTAVHGGPDGGPEPDWDFSTNANPLGPCPRVLEAVRAADVTRYPDPSYAALRAALAAHHGVDPACVVPGAGASELILRLVRAVPGPVLAGAPSFGEYARCGRAEGRAVIAVASAAEFQARRDEAGLGFLCWPNNPTGECWPAGTGSARLVIDLAYVPMCPDAEAIEAAASGALRLYAPNKSFGVTGLRAAYAVTVAPWPELAWRAPAWVLGAAEVAFLFAAISPEARAWIAASRPVIGAWRRDLAADLRGLGLAVRESPASFLLVQVGNATAVAASLRRAGMRVRDATSFGLPGWLRLRAAPPHWREALVASLREALR